MESLDQSSDHPLVKRLYTSETLAFAWHLWAERERYLDVMEQMPQTFCHLDSFRRNLFALRQRDGRQQTAAVDWAFSGIAPLGCDIAPLVWVSAIFQEITTDQIAALDKLAFQRYLEGLHNGGWKGDSRLIRLAYLIMALPNIAIPTEFLLFLDEKQHSRLEKGFGHNMTEIIDHWARLLTVAMRYADEFDQLLSEVDAAI